MEEKEDCLENITEDEDEKMSEDKMSAVFDALEIIKGVELYHMEQMSDYDYDDNLVFDYREICDGTIEENYPAEIEKITKAINVFGAIKYMRKHQIDVTSMLNDIEKSNDYQDFSLNHSSFLKVHYVTLKEMLG